jgi:hypothetical protein
MSMNQALGKNRNVFFAGLASWRPELKLRDLRALRGDKLFDHEAREAHEGRA